MLIIGDLPPTTFGCPPTHWQMGNRTSKREKLQLLLFAPLANLESGI
jgi:hypothetical protein